MVVVTALTGIFVGLDASILIGFGLSVLLFVPRAAKLRGAELIVSPERVVRERLPTDTQCTATLLFDLEGEFFFGAAPELDRYLDALRRQAVAEQVRVIVLRLKRVRNPDAVCLERLEHFLHDADRLGISVLLAGVRPDLLTAITNLGFLYWYPADHIFPQAGDDADSATLRAVRRAYDIVSEGNSCTHCADNTLTKEEKREASLYYLV